MSDPRYVPKNCAVEPDAFGRATMIVWREDLQSDNQRDRVEAAKLQHQLAVLIRRRVREKYRTMTAYAEQCRVPYDRLAKVMRGEAVMRFDDVTQAERILGGILTGETAFRFSSDADDTNIDHGESSV